MPVSLKLNSSSSEPKTDSPTVWLTTLGCAKNQVDSDKIAALLVESGYRTAPSPDQADVVMVNTCAFIEEARQQSLETVQEAEQTKDPAAKLVVLGCMAQRFRPEISQAIPQADAVLGLDQYPQLVSTLDSLTGWTPVSIRPRSSMDILSQVRRPTVDTPYAYVKVAEGCDKSCGFCAIPLIRGKQDSRSPHNIYAEVSQLTQTGVREIILVAQDLAAYGRDTTGKPQIVTLLRKLSRTEGLDWIRLLYLYPTEIRPNLVEEMTSNHKVVPYFDLSLQHVDPVLLRSMRRPGSVARHTQLIESIRSRAPQAAFRSSFVVGYPGETEQAVELLADFLAEVRLDWAGFFGFSRERGTISYDQPDQIPPDLIGERLRYLSGIQEEITAAVNAEQIGQVQKVLVDQIEEEIPLGRSYRHAPEIDGVITLDRGSPGEWVQAEITSSYGTELSGTVLSAGSS